jgi:hypothetical protein
VEQPIYDATGKPVGRVDLLLKDNVIIDRKNWQTWPSDLARKRLDKLEGQVTRYLDDPKGYTLRLEFKYDIFPEVQMKLNELKAIYGDRLQFGTVNE